MPKLRSKEGEVVPETVPGVVKDILKGKRGAGEIFICNIGTGKNVRFCMMIRHAEELHTPSGKVTIKDPIMCEFVGSKYVCKREADLSADEVSALLHALPEYEQGMIWSLSDDKINKESPISSAKGMKCPFCPRDDFQYREEYNGHVLICRKVHGDVVAKREFEKMQETVEKSDYVPNQKPSEMAGNTSV